MAVRIISAVVGIVIGASVLIADISWLYMIVLAFFGAVGVWELIRAVKCGQHKLMKWFCTIFAAIVPFVLNVPLLRKYTVTIYLAFVFCLLLIMLSRHETLKFSDVAMCGCAALAIPGALSCILFVRYSVENSAMGVFLIVYTLFCAWFGDSGAYFVGTFFGKHKLCPKVSPKKTVEGLIGGIVTVGVVVFIQCLVYNLFIASESYMSYAVLIPVGMTASAVGVLGDLTASVIKRQYDVQDFGNIMPGHGGVLDRIDGMMFNAVVIYIYISFLIL